MYPVFDIYDGDEVVMRSWPVVLPYTVELKLAKQEVKEFEIKFATE